MCPGMWTLPVTIACPTPPSACPPHSYFMVGGALSGTVGTQQGLAAAGGAAPGAGDSVFGPGVIGEAGPRPKAFEQGHAALRMGMLLLAW